VKGRAVISDGKGSLAVEDIQVGDPGPNEVLVELKASGVCHTDHDLIKAPIPLVLGHEGAGVVAAVGEGVRRVAPGERVVLSWSIPCGSCFQCVEGNQHLCERHSPLTARLGGHARLESTTSRGRPVVRAFNLGTMSTHTLVREEAVVPIDVDIPFAAASIVGCGVMTGFGSAVNAAAVRPGSSVVVLGCGGVGLNVVQGARVCGASTIIAVDVKPGRLDMAERFGATHSVVADPLDAALTTVVAEVRNLTAGRGADYAFECTAVPELGAAPLAMIRHGGMAVQVSGIEQPITVDMQLFEWDKTYINPLYGQCRPDRDFPRIFALYATGAILLDELVTTTYRIDEVSRAFEDLLAGRNAKGVLIFE
jgi:S-(hydroxymethyl)glutathione dehydrogenase/alcohol dehydrogenase